MTGNRGEGDGHKGEATDESVDESVDGPTHVYCGLDATYDGTHLVT